MVFIGTKEDSSGRLGPIDQGLQPSMAECPWVCVWLPVYVHGWEPQALQSEDDLTVFFMVLPMASWIKIPGVLYFITLREARLELYICHLTPYGIGCA